MADVGIVIPSYNAARYLPQTIRSIGEQSFVNWKCVIVDDCSADNSREIAAAACHRDPRFSLLCLEENRGTSAARNAGLAALGDGVRHVIFLDSDDVWNASSLASLIDAIERQPAWVAVYGNCRLVDHDGTYVGSVDVETACQETFDFRDGRLVRSVGAAEIPFCQLLFKNPIVSPGCMLIRADIIAKVAGETGALFDADMQCGEDLDAWFRIRRAGRVGHLNEIVLDYRRHGSNKSNKRWAMAISTRKVRLRALADPTLADRELDEACAGFRAYRTYRISKEFRSAARCLRSREIRAVGVLFGCAAISLLDILIVLMFQLSSQARKLRFGMGRSERKGEAPPDADCPEEICDALE